MGTGSPYARRELVNEACSTWRRPVTRREVVTDLVPDSSAPVGEYDGLHEAVWRFVGSLPPRQHAVIVLRFYEQLTDAEVADLMGISIGTVKSQSSPPGPVRARERARTRDDPTLAILPRGYQAQAKPTLIADERSAKSGP